MRFLAKRTSIVTVICAHVATCGLAISWFAVHGLCYMDRSSRNERNAALPFGFDPGQWRPRATNASRPVAAIRPRLLWVSEP